MKVLSIPTRSNDKSFGTAVVNKMISRLFAGILMILLSFSLGYGQQDDYLAKGTIYQIQIATISNPNDLSQYASLSDLGFLSTKALGGSASDGTYHVYLGRYLGLSSLDAVLQELANRRVSYISIESDTALLGRIGGKEITSAIMVDETPKLNLSRYGDLPGEGWDLYVFYEKGTYMVLTRLHDPVYRPLNFPTFLERLEDSGFEPTPINFR